MSALTATEQNGSSAQDATSRERSGSVTTVKGSGEGYQCKIMGNSKSSNVKAIEWSLTNLTGRNLSVCLKDVSSAAGAVVLGKKCRLRPLVRVKRAINRTSLSTRMKKKVLWRKLRLASERAPRSCRGAVSVWCCRPLKQLLLNR